MRDLRRFAVSAVIGSFSIAALMGIVALLRPGQFGETEGRVLGTTVTIGVESVAALCYLSVAGKRWQWIGAAGAVASLVAVAFALLGIWGVDSEAVGRAFGTTAISAATLAQASLLVALTARRARTVLLLAVLAAAAALAVLLTIPILTEAEPRSWYFRTLGVVAILDALGSVVLIALAVVARLTRSTSSAAVALDPAVEARLAALARARGVAPSRLVDEALDELERVGAGQGF